MDHKLKHLLHQLKGKTFPDSMRHEFGRYGDEAFDLLLFLVKNEGSTEKEVSNALIIMLSMCGQPCTTRSQELFDLSKSMLSNQSIIVRSQAVKVFLGLISISIDSPTICKLNLADKKEINNVLVHANKLGFHKEMEEYLERWMKTYKDFLIE